MELWQYPDDSPVCGADGEDEGCLGDEDGEEGSGSVGCETGGGGDEDVENIALIFDQEVSSAER